MPRMQRARRLHLWRDDRDLLADQRVDQRRLAGIGRADHRHEAATGLAGPASRRFTVIAAPPTPSRSIIAGPQPSPRRAWAPPPRRAHPAVRRRWGTPDYDPARCAQPRDRSASAVPRPAPIPAARSGSRSARRGLRMRSGHCARRRARRIAAVEKDRTDDSFADVAERRLRHRSLSAAPTAPSLIASCRSMVWRRPRRSRCARDRRGGGQFALVGSGNARNSMSDTTSPST